MAQTATPRRVAWECPVRRQALVELERPRSKTDCRQRRVPCRTGTSEALCRRSPTLAAWRLWCPGTGERRPATFRFRLTDMRASDRQATVWRCSARRCRQERNERCVTLASLSAGAVCARGKHVGLPLVQDPFAVVGHLRRANPRSKHRWQRAAIRGTRYDPSGQLWKSVLLSGHQDGAAPASATREYGPRS